MKKKVLKFIDVIMKKIFTDKTPYERLNERFQTTTQFVKQTIDEAITERDEIVEEIQRLRIDSEIIDNEIKKLSVLKLKNEKFTNNLKQLFE